MSEENIADATIEAISLERSEQLNKWGEQAKHNTMEAWVCILVEEVGELVKAINDPLAGKDARAELVQVAAVAVAWMEDLTKPGGA